MKFHNFFQKDNFKGMWIRDSFLKKTILRVRKFEIDCLEKTILGTWISGSLIKDVNLRMSD